MTTTQARMAALRIRQGHNPQAYWVNGQLPSMILDQLLDLAAKGL